MTLCTARAVAPAGAALALALALWTGAADSKPADKPGPVVVSPSDPLGGTLGQFAGLLGRAETKRGTDDRLKPAPPKERPKDFSERLYPKVAPAVVLVRTDRELGTGFLVHEDGWVVTNNHVIADARADPGTGALQATVFLGKLIDGEMEPIREGVPALVYKASAARDLALLKLAKKPAGLARLPVLALAEARPRPGQDCAAVGHPTAGMLWTLRSGQVNRVGSWPQDMTDLVAIQLGLPAKGERRAELDRVLGQMEKRKVVLSSCGVNPGDSGGPLVNDRGEVIGVTFASPKIDLVRKVDLAKFSFHVHLDELRAFLADREKLPASAPPTIPDPLPPSSLHKLIRLGPDRSARALLFGTPGRARPTGMLIDLTGANEAVTEDDLKDPVKRAGWKFQFGIRDTPHVSAFYATEGEGVPDLIVQDFDGDGVADLELRRKGGEWVVAKGKGALVDAALFRDGKLRKQFAPLVPTLREVFLSK